MSFGYDEANRRSSLTLPNGIVTSYGYDNANQLTNLTYTLGASTLGTLTYTYDLAGNRIAVGGSWARTGLPAALGSAMFDAANRIQTWNGQSMSYDANGNLASDGLTSYTWNARNQLVGLNGGVSASFAYDPFERRRSKTVGGTTTNFLYEGENLIQELTSGGAPSANLLTGLRIDEMFTRTDGGGTSTLLVDALGSILELADASGTLKTHYTYEPFGATMASGASSTNESQFTGRENDGSGLYFYRYRYYSTRFHRFASEDRVPSVGLGSYSYVMNSPTGLIDPLGLWPEIPRWLIDYWHIFWPAATSAAAGAAGPAGEAVDATMTLEEARKIREKADEIERQRRERDDEIKRAICAQQEWPFCKDLPERKKPTKSKTDPDKPDGIPEE